VLQAEVERALRALAEHRVKERRTLIVLARGAERRRVRVGFVAETPLWKMSYRLTADAGNAGRHRMQGWAVIENLSGQDWRDVELGLVSGSPVTFRQAIYRAYFVDRPEVPVEVLGRVLPRPDEGRVASLPGAGKPEREMRAAAKSAVMGGPVALEEAEAPPMATTAPGPAPGAEPVESTEGAVQVVFRYPRPVSLASGQSLVVPIVDRDVPGEQVSLYQADANARHPLAAVGFENTSESGLPPGVLTLYEQGAGGILYSGDARMGPVAAGEKRLLSFALDIKTRIDRSVGTAHKTSKGSLAHGLFRYTLVERETTTYRLTAPAKESRTVIIEQPRRPGWRLASPAEDQAELTPAGYRFRIGLKPAEERVFAVALERPRAESMRLVDVSLEQLAAFAESTELDLRLRESFKALAQHKRAIDDQRRILQQLEAERDSLNTDQVRLRENLTRVPKDGALYKRYLDKLAEQEGRFDQLARELDAATKSLDKATAAFADLINKLEL